MERALRDLTLMLSFSAANAKPLRCPGCTWRVGALAPPINSTLPDRNTKGASCFLCQSLT